MIVLFGPSGSGKTVIAHELIKMGFKRAITTTTRPKREGEVNAVDYYFVTKELMHKMFHEDKTLLEMTEYNNHYYGMSRYEFETSDFAIMEPEGIILYQQMGYDITPLYIDAEGQTCMERMIERGDSYTDVYRRLQTDFNRYNDDMWNKIKNVIFISNKDDLLSPYDVACDISNYIKNESIVSSEDTNKNIIPVRVIYDYVFEFDAEGFSEEFVDVKGLAIDSAKRDLRDRMLNDPDGCISDCTFIDCKFTTS